MTYQPTYFKIFFFSVLLLALLSIPVAGQKKSTGIKYLDTAEFVKKTEIAEWLVRYDQIAWKTSDVVMAEDEAELAKLGAEWFCFQDETKIWHAVYGKLVADKFDTVFHYLVNAQGKISRTNEKPDQSMLDINAKALVTARAKLLKTIRDGSPRFNQYIRKNDDGTRAVWLLPAFQTDGTAAFGGEAYYLIDKSGVEILKEESYFQKAFRGFKTSPPREIWLDYREVEQPTLGSIFFVLYYRRYFTKIFIDNARITSTLIGDGDSYLWLNVEKEDEEPAPKLRKLKK